MRCMTLIVGIVAALLCAGCATPRWVELPAMPTPRHDLEAVAFQGKIYAISGANDLTLDVVEVYDPKARTWSKAAPIPEKRGWFGCALLDGKAYCVGGKRVRTQEEKDKSSNKDQYEFRASLNIYDIPANRWTTGAPLGAPRAGLKAVACGSGRSSRESATAEQHDSGEGAPGPSVPRTPPTGGKVFAIGGNSPQGALNNVDVYDPAADKWTPGTPLPEGRMAPGVAALADRIFVIGGWNRKECSGVFVYNCATGKWSTGRPMPTPRRDFATAVLGTRIYCMGGVSGSRYCTEVEVYDVARDEWTVAPPLPTGKAWMGACALGGKIYVVGGANYDEQNKHYRWLDEFHVYEP